MVEIWELFEVRGTLDNEKLSGIAAGRVGSRRRITDWRKNRRTALVRSRPVLVNKASASRRKFESMRICSVDVAILCSSVMFVERIVSYLY